MGMFFRYIRGIKIALLFSAPIMAMEADSSDQLLEFRVWSYSPTLDSQGYTTLQQKPIYKSEFESRFRNCISFPDYNGTNTVENLSSAKWLRINMNPKELKELQDIIPRSIINIPYISCVFPPKTKDLLKTMNYAISAMNSDTESTRHMPIELSESDIVAKFEKKFPHIKYIDFYSTVGLGSDSYLDPETARLFTQLQDENRFSFYFTGEIFQ